MSRKNKIIISVTGIILVLVTLIGLTYAYYLTRINGNTNDKSVTVSLANLELTYSDGNGLIEATNIVPGEVIATKTFSVENTGDKKVINYTVYLDDVINTFENKNDVKLTLTCTSSKGNKCTGTEITYPSTDTLLSINDIEVEEKHNYELKVEFIETNTDQSIDMNKELSGNIIIRDLKGTGSEITNTKGTNSVSVDNAKLLSNYRIYGNSVQGENLFNKNTAERQYAYINTSNNTYSGSSDSASLIIPCETNTSYKISHNTPNMAIFRIAYINDEVPNIGSSVNANNVTIANSNENILYLETGNECKYIVVQGNASSYDNFIKTLEVKKIPTPNNSLEINSVGDLVTDTNDSNYGKYKIGVKTTGKNLFNLNRAEKDKGLVWASGIYYNLVGSVASDFIEVQKNSTYVSKYNLQVIYFDKNYNYISSFNGSNVTKTFTITNENCKYVKIAFRPSDNTGTTDFKTVGDLMLEENKTVSDYQDYIEQITNIYLDEPLRQISNYTDYMDFKSGKVVRNIKELKFDGTEDWKNYTTTNVNQMYLENLISSTSSSCLSNIAPYGVLANSRQNYKYGCYTVTSGTGIAFQLYGWNSSLTVSQWKTWLNTNNVMADYILKETLEESISLPSIDLNKVKYINIESSTNPSSIELDYVK